MMTRNRRGGDEPLGPIRFQPLQEGTSHETIVALNAAGGRRAYHGQRRRVPTAGPPQSGRCAGPGRKSRLRCALLGRHRWRWQKLDVLVGDLAILISPAGNLTETEFKKKFADWRKSIDEASPQLDSALKDKDERKQNEALRRIQELHGRRNEFTKEDSTGFVWLYLQK